MSHKSERMSILARRMQELRESDKPVRSRRVVSELMGLHHDAVRRCERGEMEPRIDTLCAIADYYNTTIDYLVGRSDRKHE